MRYEVVGFKRSNAGADFHPAFDLNEAKDVLMKMAKAEPSYERVIIRQYYTTRWGHSHYRVLHKLSWPRD